MFSSKYVNNFTQYLDDGLAQASPSSKYCVKL